METSPSTSKPAVLQTTADSDQMGYWTVVHQELTMSEFQLLIALAECLPHQV
jgi:hypothetical protein